MIKKLITILLTLSTLCLVGCSEIEQSNLKLDEVGNLLDKGLDAGKKGVKELQDFLDSKEGEDMLDSVSNLISNNANNLEDVILGGLDPNSDEYNDAIAKVKELLEASDEIDISDLTSDEIDLIIRDALKDYKK